MSGAASSRAAGGPPSGDADCLNCGAPLTGPYCARCGQKDAPLDRPLRRILAEWLDDWVALDSRLARTLHALILRPGRLTIEHNRGRRVRYVPPLRLYMVVSVVFFFVLTVGPSVLKMQVADPDPGIAAEAGAAGSDRGAFGAWLQERARLAESDPEAFERFWLRITAWSMFVLVPLAAVFLAAAFRRPKRPYVRHLVFALHAHTFAFLILAAALAGSMLLPGEDGVAAVLMSAAMAAAIVYFYLALLRVYGQGFVRTTWKSFVLGLAYLIAQAGVMVASVFVAFLLF